MAVVQQAGSYNERHAQAVAGMIADTNSCKVDSMRVQGDPATRIPFGRAVQIGATYDEAQAGVDDATFRGVTVLDKTLNPNQDDNYVLGDVASVIYEGDIWVQVEEAVAVGDNASARADNGQFSTRAAAAAGGGRPKQVAIKDAIFVTAAGAGEIAILRLGSSLPSA